MKFEFIKNIRQHGFNIAEKFGIISVVFTGWIILVNYMFGLHLSQYLRQIPFIGQLVNIELIEEFEDIQDGDPFYEELKSQLALLNLTEEDISSIQVRKDSGLQETFKIITKDWEEQNIIVKKNTKDKAWGEGWSEGWSEDINWTWDTYQILKQVNEVYYRDNHGVLHVEDGKRDVFVEVKEKKIYVEIPYTGDIPECTGAKVVSEISAAENCEVCKVCEVCPTSEPQVSDRYDEWYGVWYDKWLVACSATVDPNYDATAAAALCQKSMDLEHQKWYDAWYSIWYNNWDSAWYQRGLTDWSQEATDTAYQNGYTAWYDEGYSVGYTDGSDSCYTDPTTGP